MTEKIEKKIPIKYKKSMIRSFGSNPQIHLQKQITPFSDFLLVKHLCFYSGNSDFYSKTTGIEINGRKQTGVSMLC